jgi:predicted ATP-binding protein involved in virulence
MNVTRLQVAGLRAFEQADFVFNPHVSLLVGINGVGKTTVLDALRTCLSKILPDLTASRSRPLPFTIEDLRVGSPSMTVQLSLTLAGRDFSFVVHKQRETTIAHKEGEVREQTVDTPDKETCTPPLSVVGEVTKSADKQPLGVFFATRRSLVSDASPTSGSAGGGQASAFAEALAPRELRLSEMAQWMRAQEELASEYPNAKKHLAALHRAAKQFLPECKRLRAETSPKPRLLVQKGGMSLDVRQLSEGERGLLALVLDLARRLSQANPGLADPVKMGQAIVLIDELDLHLHPKWQRTIVESLTRTFPRCQFIATTHSPQIVAAVDPDQVLLLTDTGILVPDRTLGMDSNWILRHLMQADDRPGDASSAIREVEALIKKGTFQKARMAIAAARMAGWDLPEWSVLEARMARLEVLAK